MRRIVIDECLGCPSKKITYPSRRAAVTAAKWRDFDAGLRPYRCPACGEWHLGHPGKKGKRA